MERHAGASTLRLAAAVVLLVVVSLGATSVTNSPTGTNVESANQGYDSALSLNASAEADFLDWSSEGNASARADASACACTQDTLDCSSAGLRALDTHVHACAWPVRRVVLRHNALRALPPLPAAVEEVDLAWNGFVQLPRARQLSPETKVLDVSWNGASSAGDELHTLSSLEELRVDGNRLATLRFLPSPCALRILRAADNALWRLEDALGRCERLRELDLSGNVLGATPASALARLARLEELRLARCRLALLPPAAFHGLRQLRALDLSANELQVLPMDAIQHLNKLRSINFAGNRLKVLPPDATFSRFPLLEAIHLSSNAISVLSENTFANLTFLEVLELDSNRLHTLPPGIFSGLINVHRLVLSDNPLPARSLIELAPLRNLRSLYLNRCAIRELPSQAFANQPRLQVLSACCNLMYSIDGDSLQGLLQLRALKLGNNSLDALPESLFRDTPGLHDLDVSLNRLSSLPPVIFTHLRSLKILDASGNRLRALPALDECCAPPATVLLGDNELRAPDAAALHGWLRAGGGGGGAGPGAGSEGALVDLRGRHARFGVHELAHALDSLRAFDASASAQVQVLVEAGDCACGGVRRRRGATVLFCVDVACAADVPGVPPDWVAVANRTARYARVADTVGVVVASGDAAVVVDDQV